MQRRIILATILTIVMLFSVISIASAEQWVPIDEFKIGKVIHLTGDIALTGEKQRQGLELEVEKVNAAGGLNGVPVKVYYEDDLGTNPGAIAALNKLLYDHEVYVTLATVRSTMVHALAPIIEEEQVPAIYGGSAWSISELGNEWSFRVRCEDRSVGAAMAKFIVEELGHTKIAALHDSDAFGSGGHEETARALKELYDIEPVTIQRYSSGTRDYTAQWMAIRNSGATAVYGWGTRAEDNGIILRQRQEFALDGLDFVGSASYGNTTTRSIAEDTVYGIYSLSDFTIETQDPSQQQYIADFKARFDGRIPDSDMTWTTTAMIVFADAIERADVLKVENGQAYMRPLEETRLRIRDAIRETSGLQTVLGIADTDIYHNLIHSIEVVEIIPEGERHISTVSVDFEPWK